jgi:hypothetical protein
MNARHLILALAASAPLLAQAPPQPAPQPPVFRAGTDLVEVEVITRDKSGIFVGDLALDDFELREDGKPYPVQQVYLRVAGANGWNDALRGSAAAASPAGVSAPPDAAARRIFVVVFDDAHLAASWPTAAWPTGGSPAIAPS